MSNTVDLVFISFPHQWPYARSALLASACGASRDERDVVIFVWSYNLLNHRRKSVFLSAMRAIIGDSPARIIFAPSTLKRALLLAPMLPRGFRARIIRQMLNQFKIGSVFFAHDASADRTAQACMQAFPTALRVCFGDPPGFTYQSPPERRRRPLRDFFYSSVVGIFRVLGCREPRFELRQQVCITAWDLPLVAERSRFAERKRVSKALLVSAIDEARVNLGRKFELQFSQIFDVDPRLDQSRIVILSNFFESNIMDLHVELEIYTETISKILSPSGFVLVKFHPGSGNRKKRELTSFFKNNDRVIFFPERFDVVPIECLARANPGFRWISFSSVSIVLREALAEDVDHAISPSVEEVLGGSDVALTFKAANRLLRESLSGEH
jgi:hypothetical protein